MPDPIRLSTEGSDRATAYNFSNKILRHTDGLLVGWLDAPTAAKGPTRIQLGICDPESGELRDIVPLGEGVDNHCGPSLVLGDDGAVHVFTGSHHGDFHHRWSATPADAASWSSPAPVGPGAGGWPRGARTTTSHSYPAVVIDAERTFHLVYRESYRGEGETWQLEYTRRPRGGDWSVPTVLARSPVPGYNHFMHSLSIGPTGALHVTFQFHYAASGSARQGKGKLAAHIRSDDGGATWTNEGQACELPLTIHGTRAFVSVLDDPDASIRIGTHVVDADDEPWLFCAMPEAPHGTMMRRTADGWQAINLDAALPDMSFTGGGRSTATSRDADGTVHLLISTQPRGAGEGWYHETNEVHHVAFGADGTLAEHQQLTVSDPEQPHWLPSVEYWNWRRPGDVDGGHWYTWTAGRSAGWMDRSNYDDTLKTEVWLGRL